MSDTRELSALEFEMNLTSGDYATTWEDRWYPIAGVETLDLMLDLRNIKQAAVGGSAVGVLPALQFAEVRTDRPTDGAVITTGSPAPKTTVDLYKFSEDLTASTGYWWFRRGVAAKVTSGTFARIRGILYGSYRQSAMLLPAEEIVVHPTKDNTLVSVYPLGGGRAVPAVGVTKARAAITWMGNDTGATTVVQLYLRAFNDPMARGAWTAMGSTSSVSTTNGVVNTTDVTAAGLTIANYQWVELGLGVSRTAGTASKVTFNVLSALLYT